MSAFGVMVAAPFGVTNGTILKLKCDISCVPNLTFGEGEAMRRREFLSGMAWWSLVTLPSLTEAQTFPAVSSNLAFALTAPDGTSVTEQTYRGKWLVIYFGYTFCPDVCPTTLMEIGGALKSSGPACG